jgi:hypothetical protein
VVFSEVPGQSLHQLGNLGSHPGLGHLRQHVLVAFALDQRGQHRPTRGPSGEPEANPPRALLTSSAAAQVTVGRRPLTAYDSAAGLTQQHHTSNNPGNNPGNNEGAS